MLTGLFAAALADPGLARARDLRALRCRAGRRPRPDRPGRAAPVRGRRRRGRRARGWRRPPGARGHRHHPGGRGPRRGAGRPAPGGAGRGLPGLGDAAARAALAALATPSGGGWPCCAGWPTRTDAHGAGPLRVVVAPVRSRAAAAAQGPRRPGAGASCAAGDERRPGRGRPPARRHRVRPGRPGHQARRVRRPRRHPRRLPAHRGAPARGSSSGATRSRRSAPSPSPTSAPSRRSTRLWAPPCRELLLTADGPGAGRARWPQQHPELAEMLDKLAEGIPVEGMESLAPALLDGATAGAAARLHAGRHRTCCSATRSGSAPGRTTWSAPARSSCRRAGPRPPVGGQAPIDLGAAAFRTLAEVRAAAPRAGPAVVVGVARSAWPRRTPPRGRQPWRGRADRGRRHADDAGSRRPWPPSRRRSTTARPRGWSTTSSAGPATAGGSRWSSRGTARPQRAVEVLRDAGLGARLVDGDADRAAAGEVRGHLRRPRPRLRRRGGPARRAHRQRHHRRPGRVHQGHAQDAEPAAQHHRPAGAAGRRLRGARAARHRPVRRDGAAHGQRRRPGVPGHRVRAEQARPARRPALRADRPARPALPLRRRRAARRCTRWAARTGRRPRPGPARRSARSPPS